MLLAGACMHMCVCVFCSGAPGPLTTRHLARGPWSAWGDIGWIFVVEHIQNDRAQYQRWQTWEWHCFSCICVLLFVSLIQPQWLYLLKNDWYGGTCKLVLRKKIGYSMNDWGTFLSVWVAPTPTSNHDVIFSLHQKSQNHVKTTVLLVPPIPHTDEVTWLLHHF
jgi:hypothetical protein